MIVGTVDPRRQSFVSLDVLGSEGRQETITVLIDTGFSGSLLLPLEVIERLGLSQTEAVTMRLADNSRVEVPRYLAQVMWDGVMKPSLFQPLAVSLCSVPVC